MRDDRPGVVIAVGAQFQQGCAAGAKGGVEGAVGKEPHHAVVIGEIRSTRWLGSGVTGNQDLAVALCDDRIGEVLATDAEIQQGPAAGAKVGVERAVVKEPHHAVVSENVRTAYWVGIGGAGNEDLAVVLHDDRPGLVIPIRAEI